MVPLDRARHLAADSDTRWHSYLMLFWIETGEEAGHRHDASLQPSVVVGSVGGRRRRRRRPNGQSELGGGTVEFCRLHRRSGKFH